jgi:hypothetical protein
MDTISITRCVDPHSSIRGYKLLQSENSLSLSAFIYFVPLPYSPAASRLLIIVHYLQAIAMAGAVGKGDLFCLLILISFAVWL